MFYVHSKSCCFTFCPYRFSVLLFILCFQGEIDAALADIFCARPPFERTMKYDQTQMTNKRNHNTERLLICSRFPWASWRWPIVRPVR